MSEGRSLKNMIRGLFGLGGKVATKPDSEEPVGAISEEYDKGGLAIGLSGGELERQYAAGYRNRDADKYFQLLQEIEDSIKAGRFDRVKKAAKASMPLLGELIRSTKSTSGTGVFDLKRIPAIDRAGKIAVAQGDLETLKVLQNEVDKHDDLKQWKETLGTMIADVEVVESILATIRETPGYVQKDLKKSVRPRGARLSDLCHWMDKVGRIRREKSGNSYKLFAT